MLWFAESTGVAQVEDPTASIGAEDSVVQTSAGEPSAVEFAAASVTVKATTTDVLEVLASAALSEDSVVGLVPAQVESTPVFVGVTRPVIEMGSESALAGSSPTTDFMEELAHQMMQQFFTFMKSCIELVLFGGSSFEFAQMLLENQIKNIRHTGSPTQARVYLMLVDQLGIYLWELKTLEKTSSMDEARSMLGKLLAAQEHERKEIEEQMAKEAHNFQHFHTDYQRLVDDSKESEVVIQSVEQVIAIAQVAIAKAQALIQVNEQKLTVARTKPEETAKTQVQENLVFHSSRLESLQS